MKNLLLATVIGLTQLSPQVQMQVSSQNVTLGQDVTFVNHSIVALSNNCNNCSPGLHYIGQPKIPLIGYTPGALYVVTIDQPNQLSATLDLGPGPMAIVGTCTNMCIVLVQGATSSTPAVWLVK
jgi:hypothetical protein